MAALPLPAHDDVATLARRTLTLIQNDLEYLVLQEASIEHCADWPTLDGVNLVSDWEVERDARPLFAEALRALTLKSAVYELLSDENAAEVALPTPVAEMTHAVLCQAQMVHRICENTGIHLVHRSDRARTSYSIGCYTYRCYVTAWGPPPIRYWLPNTEVVRRRMYLAGLLNNIGIRRSGRQHAIIFPGAVSAGERAEVQ